MNKMDGMVHNLTLELSRLSLIASSEAKLALIPPDSSSLPAVVTFSEACPCCGFGPDEPGRVREDVPVGHPDFGKSRPCPECYLRKMAATRQYCPPLEGELAAKTFENFWVGENQAALAAAQAFAREPKGMLIFYGPNGRGKSHLIAAIYNHLLEYGVPARYVSMLDWASQLRSKVGDEEPETPEAFYQFISQFPITLIDDFDQAEAKGWTREQILRLVGRRSLHLETRGTVLALEEKPVQRGWLGSRLHDERVKLVELRGPDNRGQLEKIRQLLRSIKLLGRP